MDAAGQHLGGHANKHTGCVTHCDRLRTTTSAQCHYLCAAPQPDPLLQHQLMCAAPAPTPLFVPHNSHGCAIGPAVCCFVPTWTKWLTSLLSKSSPPRWVSPAVAFTSKIPSSMLSRDTSKVPPPRSKISTLRSPVAPWVCRQQQRREGAQHHCQTMLDYREHAVGQLCSAAHQVYSVDCIGSGQQPCTNNMHACMWSICQQGEGTFNGAANMLLCTTAVAILL